MLLEAVFSVRKSDPSEMGHFGGIFELVWVTHWVWENKRRRRSGSFLVNH